MNAEFKFEDEMAIAKNNLNFYDFFCKYQSNCDLDLKFEI